MTSTPQPISTPTKLGTTLSVRVMVVPITQPAPLWASGMIRILLPWTTSCLHNSSPCWIAVGSSLSVKTIALLYFPATSSTVVPSPSAIPEHTSTATSSQNRPAAGLFPFSPLPNPLGYSQIGGQWPGELPGYLPAPLDWAPPNTPPPLPSTCFATVSGRPPPKLAQMHTLCLQPG